MTDELNTAVQALWHEQTSYLTQVPMFVAAYTEELGSHLAILRQAAEQAQNQDLVNHIDRAWECAGQLNEIINGQQMIASNAGVIAAALKVQRDEMALQLQQVLMAAGNVGEPLTGYIDRLYDNWLENLDTTEVESDAQDELLDAIKSDIEWVWHLEQGRGDLILNVLRGNVELTQEQAAALHAFVHAFD